MGIDTSAPVAPLRVYNLCPTLRPRFGAGAEGPGFQGFRAAGLQGWEATLAHELAVASSLAACARVPGFQGFRVTGFQGYRVPGFQGYRGWGKSLGFQGFRVSGGGLQARGSPSMRGQRANRSFGAGRQTGERSSGGGAPARFGRHRPVSKQPDEEDEGPARDRGRSTRSERG